LRSAREFGGRKLKDRVSDLLGKGQFKEARRLVQDELDLGDSIPKRRQIDLLNSLITIELRAKRPVAVLEALSQRRALGYRNWQERLDEGLSAAAIFARFGKLFEARAELTKVLRDKNCLRWDSLLRALELYVEMDVACREEMETILTEASDVAIHKNGIPVASDQTNRTVEEKIKSVSATYRAASKGYEALLLRAFDPANLTSREALLKDIREYISSEKVAFFVGLGQELSEKLTSSRVSKSL